MKFALTPEDEEMNVSIQQPSSSAMTNNKKTPKCLVCPICNITFTKRYHLTRHLKIHSGEKPHVCYVCKKSFLRIEDLKRHLKVHEKIKSQHVCDECSDIFQRKYELLEHKKKLHRKDLTKYSCGQCSETFKRKFDLLAHKKKLHRKDLTKYSCDQCSETFKRKLDLLAHKRMLHRKNLTKYSCDQCNETFKRKFDFKKHVKIHREKPIQHLCDECNGTFQRKYDLTVHKKKVHLKILTKHSCNQCSVTFKCKADLRRHFRDLHRTAVNNTSPSHDMLREKTKHFKRKNALNVFATTTLIPNKNFNQDFLSMFNNLRPDILNELMFQLHEKRGMKWYIIVTATLSRTNQDGDLEYITPHFRSNVMISYLENDIAVTLEEAFGKIINSFENFTQQGSGWTLEKIDKLELFMAKCKLT